MKVSRLRDILNNFNDEDEVYITKKHLCGNVTQLDQVQEISVSLFGFEERVVLLRNEIDNPEIVDEYGELNDFVDIDGKVKECVK